MENRADCGAKCPMTILALPTLSGPIAACMAVDRLAFAIGTNGMTAPAYPFKVFDGLFLSLKRLENLDDIHSRASFKVAAKISF